MTDILLPLYESQNFLRSSSGGICQTFGLHTLDRTEEHRAGTGAAAGGLVASGELPLAAPYGGKDFSLPCFLLRPQ